jgi:putative Mg2+ transporter-C (MgtC) family protein
LTTASAVWVTACIGCACGLANWKPVVIACLIIALLLGLGGRFEHWVHGKFDAGKGSDSDKPGSDLG